MTRKEIVNELTSRKKTISVAESLTGGLLASAFIGVSGASNVFNGGIVAYTLKIKEQVLGIPLSHTSISDGVDKVTSELMAKNVCNLMDSNFGLSTTGIAEKYDERPEQAFISLYIKEEDLTITRHIVFKDLPEFGSRDSVRKDIVQKSMTLISDYLDPSIII